MGTQKARCRLSRRLDALAGGTGGDVGADGAGHARPPEVGSHSIQGFGVAEVTSGGGVVELIQEALAKARISGNAEARVEVPETVRVELDERRALGIRCVVGIRTVRSLDVIDDGVGEYDVGR